MKRKNKIPSMVWAILLAILSTGCSASENTNEDTVVQFYKVRIMSVIDGDTIRVQFKGEVPTGCKRNETVRIIGVDAPELNLYTDEKPEPYAEEARDYTNKYFNTVVKIMFDEVSSDRDIYGRVLAHIWLEDGSCLARELIRNGLGKYISYYPFRASLMKSFEAAEINAQINHVGVWQKCF